MTVDLPLVARADELATLGAAIEGARQGSGQAVLIGGEAGIGKTRLLDEARAVARGYGLPVLRGRAVQAGGAYRPIVEAVTRLAGRYADHPDLVAARPALSRILPGWSTAATVMAPMADPNAILVQALIDLLVLAAPDGAVMIIDDLQ